MYRQFLRILMVFMAFLWPLDSGAQSVSALRDSAAQWQALADSLQQRRLQLERDVQHLSGMVDSLKRVHGSKNATGALEVALRESVGLALSLERVYERELAVDQALTRVYGALREAYDKEINTVISDLNAGVDIEKIQYLKTLQNARNAISTQMQARKPQAEVPDVAIRPEDGPEAIRQKAEFMADVASVLAEELQKTDARVKRLENELHLRARTRDFVAEISLFDDGAALGRALNVQQGSLPAETNTRSDDGFVANGANPSETENLVGVLPEQPDLVSLPKGEVLNAGQEVALPASNPGALSLQNGLVHEIGQLKQQREVLAQQVVKATTRAEILRLALERLLEGKP